MPPELEETTPPPETPVIEEEQDIDEPITTPVSDPAWQQAYTDVGDNLLASTRAFKPTSADNLRSTCRSFATDAHTAAYGPKSKKTPGGKENWIYTLTLALEKYVLALEFTKPQNTREALASASEDMAELRHAEKRASKEIERTNETRKDAFRDPTEYVLWEPSILDILDRIHPAAKDIVRSGPSSPHYNSSLDLRLKNLLWSHLPNDVQSAIIAQDNVDTSADLLRALRNKHGTVDCKTYHELSDRLHHCYQNRRSGSEYLSEMGTLRNRLSATTPMSDEQFRRILVGALRDPGDRRRLEHMTLAETTQDVERIPADPEYRIPYRGRHPRTANSGAGKHDSAGSQQHSGGPPAGASPRSGGALARKPFGHTGVPSKNKWHRNNSARAHIATEDDISEGEILSVDLALSDK